MRVAREVRPDPEEAELDLARIKAEREADADEIAAMLVRVADTERQRVASEQRAVGLEGWTLELEAKVAEARTRADDQATQSAELRKLLAAAESEVATLRARVKGLEAQVATVRREAEDAVELERVKRSIEIDALVAQQAAALALRGESAESGRSSTRSKLAALGSTLDALDRLEAETHATRQELLEQARRAIAVSNDHVTAPPPAIHRARTSPGPTTIPPANKPGKKKSRRPSAPPTPPAAASVQPITKPGEQLETFEDLLDSSD